MITVNLKNDNNDIAYLQENTKENNIYIFDSAMNCIYRTKDTFKIVIDDYKKKGYKVINIINN